MARQIKNRREDLYIPGVPAEIPANIVTTTSFATSSTAGVIKVSTVTGIGVSGNGNLIGQERTLEQYTDNTGNMIISKATLENVIFAVVKAKIQADMGAIYEAADIDDTWTVILRKTADGLVFDYAPTE